MRNFNLLAVVAGLLLLLFIIRPSVAEMSPSQIKVLREDFPVKLDEEIVQDLIKNYDHLRTWIIDDVTNPTRAPGPSAIPGLCDICQLGIRTILSIVRTEEQSLPAIKHALSTLCSLIIHPDVCKGVADIYGDPLFWIFRNNLEITALDICGMYTGIEGGCPPISEHLRNWTIQIPGNKPELKDLPLLPANHPSVRFLQLTDIHPDLDYMVGSNATCTNIFMCCRKGDTAKFGTEINTAGVFGDYQCDMPKDAMLGVFEHAKQQYNDYKFILMTGDLVHHAVWNTNKSQNIQHFNSVNLDLPKRFPGIPIYPVIGNHESHPCNMYPPSSVWSHAEWNNSWVYDTIADAYKDYLPAEAEADFRAAGYYVVKPPGTEGLRLIILNTNFCYTNNWWLFYEAIDVENHLEWLKNKLLEAEVAGDKVFLVGHIPPGKTDCWTVWNHQFYRIVHRFEAIIKAQFYGHTHNDETTIFFDNTADPENPRPMNSLNIGVSTTAYTKLNPGYKVYYADGADATGSSKSWELMDHETFVYNLSQANNAAPEVGPQWYKLYNMKEAFELPSLRPAHLYELVVKMIWDDELFQKYFRFYHKDSHLAKLCLDMECRYNYLCEIVRADSGDYSHCDRLRQIPKPMPSTDNPNNNASASTYVIRFHFIYLIVVFLNTLQ